MEQIKIKGMFKMFFGIFGNRYEMSDNGRWFVNGREVSTTVDHVNKQGINYRYIKIMGLPFGEYEIYRTRLDKNNNPIGKVVQVGEYGDIYNQYALEVAELPPNKLYEIGVRGDYIDELNKQVKELKRRENLLEQGNRRFSGLEKQPMDSSLINKTTEVTQRRMDLLDLMRETIKLLEQHPNTKIAEELLCGIETSQLNFNTLKEVINKIIEKEKQNATHALYKNIQRGNTKRMKDVAGMCPSKKA